MPLRLRWAAATAAALLALALAVFVGRRAPAPTLYRLDLEVPAIDAALWLVDRYPDYFEGVEGADFAAWSAPIPDRERAFVLSLAHHLTWVWIDREVAAIVAAAGGPENLSLGTVGTEATRRIRDQTLNQLEVSIHSGLGRTLANIDEPDFLAGALSRLVRGLSNCEGQNHFLLLILERILGPRGAEVAWIRSAEHTLVEVKMPGRTSPIYFDAWSNLPPYVFAAAREDPSVRTYAELVADAPFVIAGRRGRIHDRPDRLDPAARPWEHLPRPEDLPLWSGPPPAGIDVRRPAISAEALAAGDLRRLFLSARVHHLYGARTEAITLYQAVDARCPDHPPGDEYACVSARHYLDHLGAPRRSIAP